MTRTKSITILRDYSNFKKVKCPMDEIKFAISARYKDKQVNHLVAYFSASDLADAFVEFLNGVKELQPENN